MHGGSVLMTWRQCVRGYMSSLARVTLLRDTSLQVVIDASFRFLIVAQLHCLLLCTRWGRRKIPAGNVVYARSSAPKFLSCYSACRQRRIHDKTAS